MLHVLYRFLHWTLTNSTSNELFKLDLRDNTSLVSLLQLSWQWRDVLSSLVPTAALAQDPQTSRIWLSDKSSGDILSCVSSLTLMDCQVEVDAGALDNGVAGEFLCVWDEVMLIRVIWQGFMQDLEFGKE